MMHKCTVYIVNQSLTLQPARQTYSDVLLIYLHNENQLDALFIISLFSSINLYMFRAHL